MGPNLESQLLGFGSWVWPGSFGSVVITKCDKKLLQKVTGITKYDSYYKVWQKVITKCDRYYKVLQVLQSATGITKCDKKL